MKNFLILFYFLAFVLAPSLASAENSYDALVAAKRAQAEEKRASSMQRIQHMQQNPDEYLRNKSSADASGKAEEFKVSGDGHYYVQASINSKSLRFMADTGATGIFISQSDARSVGINPSTLNYSQNYTTANGTHGRAALTTAKTLKVGSIILNDVPVVVSMESNHIALLGMEFFSRLKRYEVSDGTLSLYK